MQPDQDATAGRLAGLSVLAQRYDLILSDVWGVLHNGVRAWEAASEALTRFRQGGGTVILVSNAPRPGGLVARQVARLGAWESAWDAIVTSGDLSRDHLAALPPGTPVYRIGPARDDSLVAGLDIRETGPDEAEVVLCTGLVDELHETPEDYRGLLARLAARRLPLICANPDLVVEVGERLVWCAGALAELYASLGGPTIDLGKPHRPVYERAFAIAGKERGAPVSRERTLAIGDAIRTDLAGAAAVGIDFLMVTAGIHQGELGPADDPDPERVARLLATGAKQPVGWIPRLSW